MSVHITLASAEFDDVVTQASAAIRSGGVAVLAAEHAYMYVCDAFNRDGVSNIHTLRGDAAYTACQVMVGSGDVLKGVATDYDDEYQLLADKFWPGLLSIHVMPHYSLNWDLGDGGELSEFVVRVPSAKLLRAVIEETGPVAVASAAIAGNAPNREIAFIPATESSITIYVDEGELPAGAASTVIRRKVLGVSGGLEVLREGAISLENLQAFLPSITAHVSEEPPVN